MADTYVALSLSGATFADGSTLSGTWTGEYDDAGNLVSIINPDLTVTSADGKSTTTFTASNGTSGNNSAYQFFSQGNGGGFYNLYLDWNGENPNTLSATGSTYTSIVNPSGQVETLTSTGTVTNVTNAVTSTLSGAEFADGSSLAGTWTAIYDAGGTLVGVENAAFTVTGPQGSTTFTEAGTLPYADSPSSTSFEIHFLSSTDNGGGYQSLYVDWRSQNPSSLYEGTPSLYTSVVNTSGSSTAPIRLINDGTTGQGILAVINGLPATEAGSDAETLSPFSGVSVTDAESSTVSATITLHGTNGVTDDNGALSGTGVTRIGVGTYQISATTPAQLTTDLQSVAFTPTAGQGAAGTQTTTQIAVAVNDTDGSTSASTSVTVTATCFLSGTLIATPDGERPIETLAAGDLVTVMIEGRLEAAPVAWAGSGRMDVTRNGCDDGFPVRIRAGAFADGSPRRDLLVTPEHCLLVDGGLIPARMLVNGASILVDRSMPTYAFFHIELDRHGILLAEALPVESYLDTGNRHLFGGPVAGAAPNDGCSLSPMMAAPLRIAREQVEPVWHRLRHRAVGLGLHVPAEPARTARDPDLRVLLDDGRTVSSDRLQHDRYVFRIPRGRQAIRLLSNSAVPSEVVGPFLDDRRRLGVAVDRIVLRSGDETRELPVACMNLAGWHAMEHERRWTDGNAVLALSEAVVDSFLDIQVVGVMEYAA